MENVGKFLRGWLLGAALACGLAWGGHWLWENRRDEVLGWKERGTEWFSSLAEKGKGWTDAGRAPSGAGERQSPPPPGTKDDGMRKTASPPPQAPPPPVAKAPDWWKKGDNWTRTKAADLDDLTDGDRELILSWDARKPGIAGSLGTVRESVARITSAPAYAYDRKALERLQADLDVLARCLAIGDPLRLADRFPAMESDFRSFMSSVRWQAGIAHPTAPHVHSGTQTDSWEPDDGYVWVSASRNDGNLAVLYRGHAYRCGHCHGSGVIVETVTCPNCRGEGKVPNPVIQAGNIIVGVGNAASFISAAFSGNPAPPPAQQIYDSGIPCGVCHGNASIPRERVCPHCENGTVWR